MDFLPVKTWLLIVCDTAFYAIILFESQSWCERLRFCHYHDDFVPNIVMNGITQCE